MAQVKYIKSAAHIPKSEKYVLVQRGAEDKRIRHERGQIVVVATAPAAVFEETFATAIEDAKHAADKEGMALVYVIDRRKQERAKLTR